MKKKLIKGFTLIEMMVVIAIIAILAGIVLTGVGGIQAGGRDAKRIADLRNMQTYMESYAQRCGHYPGVGDCALISAPGDWATFQAALTTVGITLPQDPINIGTRVYSYATNAAAGYDLTKYVLGAVLERDNNIRRSAGVVSANPDSALGWQTLSDRPMNCALNTGNTFGYCVGNL